MKAPVDKLLPFLQRETFLARQKRATVELNTHNIRMMIVEAAANGLTGVRVKIARQLKRERHARGFGPGEVV